MTTSTNAIIAALTLPSRSTSRPKVGSMQRQTEAQHGFPGVNFYLTF